MSGAGAGAGTESFNGFVKVRQRNGVKIWVCGQAMMTGRCEMTTE